VYVSMRAYIFERTGEKYVGTLYISSHILAPPGTAHSPEYTMRRSTAHGEVGKKNIDIDR